jgi:tRNA 2-thiouridine synthesizing protein A
MAEGEELIVLVTDPASVIDFKHFCNTTAHELVEHTQAEGVFTYRIRRGAA